MLDLLTVATEVTGRMQRLPEWLSGGAIVGTQGGQAFVMDKLGELLKTHPDCPVAALWLQVPFPLVLSRVLDRT